jgi:2-keto-4-pentenoate hydratase/2-oxohepta-3-ene-1,7-dioic acid hydratase in catechol pathway
MKICWFDNNRLGVVKNGQVFDVSQALQTLPPATYPQRTGDLLITHLAKVRVAIESLLPKALAIPLIAVKLRSPVAHPGKIIGVPVNYQKHVEEAAADVATFTGREIGGVAEQGLFLKASSSLIGCSEAVRISMPERLTHHEIELGLVIGKRARNVAAVDALSYVAGYAIALDMTVRGSEHRSMRKSLDTYSVLGPWLVTADEIANPQHLALRLQVNGKDRQVANTGEMIVPIAQQIAWASRFYTLEPGDIIMTGTCEGVGPVVPGDVMHAEIEAIGAMDVTVTQEAPDQ